MMRLRPITNYPHVKISSDHDVYTHVVILLVLIVLIFLFLVWIGYFKKDK